MATPPLRKVTDLPNPSSRKPPEFSVWHDAAYFFCITFTLVLIVLVLWSMRP